MAIFIVLSFQSCVEISEEPPSFSNISSRFFKRKLLYGFDLNQCKLSSYKVKRGECMAGILGNLGVSPPITYKISMESENYEIKLNKIKPRDKYLVFEDTMGNLQGLIYYKDFMNYLVIDLRDSLKVSQETHKINLREKEIILEVKTSLYESVLEQDTDLSLVSNLSDIFAWKINFFKLYPNDVFKVILEEAYVQDSIYVGIKHIKAIYAENNKQPFYAFYYENDSISGYYDEEGNSLQGQFLKAPLKYSRITSRYKLRRYHPVLKKWKSHKGIDYGAPTGTPVRATADGIVTHSTYKSYNGNYIKIMHNSVYSTQYLHLSKRLVKKGQRVKQGQIIGKVGSTGLATGPHLCYRFWKHGKQIDPYKESFRSIKKLDPKEKQLFKAQTLSLKTRLNHM